MKQNRLFNRTRLQLAALYAAVMGVILGVGGWAMHEMIMRLLWQTLDQELVTLTGTLHDGIEGVLAQPEVINSEVEEFLPGLCLQGRSCLKPTEHPRHTLGLVQQQGYYVRFVALDGKILGTLGQQPPGIAVVTQPGHLREVQDLRGYRYHQISVFLKTKELQPWGYLQIGRSIKEYDDLLQNIRLTLFLGLPILMVLVGFASWWIAGRAIQPIYRSYEQMQQFTADAAHELRTPLATTLTTVESSLICDSLEPAEAHQTLQIIQRQMIRLTQLAQDLLFLSKLDQWPLSAEQNPVNLQDLLMDLEEELSPLALEQAVEFQAEIQIPSPLWVLGNEGQLYRLFINLITNALQFTPAKGQVYIKLGQEGKFAVVYVRDTGIGISKVDQQRIFDRFFRVASDRSRQTGGTGLGLAIVKAIVQAHRGVIQVQSQPDHGSTFTVRLPLIAPKSSG